MVCIGLADDDTTLGFHDVVRSQHRIQGSYAYTMPDFEQAFEWLVSGRRRSATTCPTCARWTTARRRSRGSRAARRRPSSRSSSPHEDDRRHRRVEVGIGLATAHAFVAAGDTVHAAARRAIDEPGVIGHRLDITDREAVAPSPRASTASTR